MAVVNVKSRNKRFEIEGVAADDPYIHGFLDANVEHERSFQRFCRTYLPSDCIAIDVGANIGVTGLIMSEYFNSGKIYALEPGAKTYRALERNLERNAVKNVIPFNLAISNKTHMVSFADNSAYGRIAEEGAIGDNLNTVQATTLDDFVESQKLSRIDFIKVDIEGFEPDFFEGAKKTIEKFAPIIYFELNSWAMLVNGPRDPIGFVRDVAREFPFTYRVCGDDASDIIERLDHEPDWVAKRLVHDNVVFFSSVNDVVVSKQEIMNTDREVLVSHIDRLNEELAPLRAELAALRNEHAGSISAYAELHSTNKAEINQLNAKLDTFAELQSANEAEIDRLKSELDAFTAERLILEARVGILSARSAALAGPWKLRELFTLYRLRDQIGTLLQTDISDADFVDALYMDLFGRAPDPAGKSQYLRWLGQGRTRAGVFLALVKSPEFRS